MSVTSIEWCDITINPIVGCTKCSEGCRSCYAERFAARLAKNPKTAAKYAGVVDENGKWTGKLSALDLSCFDKLPMTPKRIFVGSMTDLFHEKSNYENVDRIFLAMNRHPAHTFLVLTKRPERMRRYITSSRDGGIRHPDDPPWPPLNLWIGVTVCDQEEADEKIPILLATPAAKRFVSIEPMLGPVDLLPSIFDSSLPLLDWVICGGETGPNARPMHPDWVRSLRDRCQAAGVPFFFKGWGDWQIASFENGHFDYNMERNKAFWVFPDGVQQKPSGIRHGYDGGKPWAMIRVGKKTAGRLLDGREWNEVP